MADLFNYTRSQSMVTPQSPFVQATPAKSSFSNISKLVEFAQKAQLATLSQQSTDLTAQQKAANIDNESALTEAYIANDTQQALMYQDYVQTYTEAGSDIQQKQTVKDSYLTESEAHFGSLPPVLQAKLLTSKQAFNASASNQYLKDETEFNKDEFINKTNASVSTYFPKSTLEKKEQFNLLQEEAVKKGFTKNEFATGYSQKLFDYQVANLPEDLIQQRGFAYIDDLDRTITELKEIDPNNTKLHMSFKETANKFRNQLNAMAMNDINDNITTGKYDAFEQAIGVAQLNNVINQDEVLNYYEKFNNKSQSTSTRAEVAVNEAIALGNGTISVTDPRFSDTKTRNLYENSLTNMYTQGIQSDTVAPNMLQAWNTNNKPTYQKAFKSVFSTALGRLEGMLRNQQATPEDHQKALQELNFLSQRSFGSLDESTLAKYNVAKILVAKSKPEAVAQAFESIDAQGGVPLIATTDDEIKKLRKSVAPNKFNQARVMASALYQTNTMTKEEAVDAIVEGFGYTNFNDRNRKSIEERTLENINAGGLEEFAANTNKPLYKASDVKISNSFDKVLADKGLLNRDDFLDSLTNENSATYLGEEKRAALVNVLAGKNPKFDFVNNELVVTNESGTGSIFRIPLYNADIEQMIRQSNDITFANTPEPNIIQKGWRRLSRGFAMSFEEPAKFWNIGNMSNNLSIVLNDLEAFPNLATALAKDDLVPAQSISPEAYNQLSSKEKIGIESAMANVLTTMTTAEKEMLSIVKNSKGEITPENQKEIKAIQKKVKSAKQKLDDITKGTSKTTNPLLAMPKEYDSNILKNINTLGNLLAEGESRGSYNVLVGQPFPLQNLTKKTINEILEYGSRKGGSAAGKYQIINKTLKEEMKKLKLTGEELFDEQMQDRIFVSLLEKRGLKKYLAGEINKETFANNLAQEWAASPIVSGAKRGSSYYESKTNSAKINVDDILKAVSQLRKY